MMNPLTLIDKYYPTEDQLKSILTRHSRSVADMSLQIAANHPELALDKEFLEEAAMLHDIGIFLTDAPSIHCHGTHPYICHGYLGAELLRREGWERHALVSERHTGVGLTKEKILKEGWPLPARDMVPISPEEEVICFADLFFSKVHYIDHPRTIEQVMSSVAHFSAEAPLKVSSWTARFL